MLRTPRSGLPTTLAAGLVALLLSLFMQVLPIRVAQAEEQTPTAKPSVGTATARATAVPPSPTAPPPLRTATPTMRTTATPEPEEKDGKNQRNSRGASSSLIRVVTPTPDATPTARRAPSTPTASPTPTPDAIAAVLTIEVTETPSPTPTPTATSTPAIRPASDWPTRARNADGLSIHVLGYLPLILGAADLTNVDPAVIAALMDVEGSGPSAVSPAGAAGVMQLMPDKLTETDDPFDPATNILRAAQFIRRLVAAYGGDLASVAAAYFGAVDHSGAVTDDSDGNVNGIEYVERFADAYQRWAAAFNQPAQVIAIRPVIRQRVGAVPEDVELLLAPWLSPERDRWYLYVDRPQPAMPPILS